MRTAFLDALMALAKDDARINLVVGDIGFGVVERFAQRFPLQFLNVGVAEQNMTGIAAGLALSGRIVFTYSIANFSTLRCLEQIRNDVCCHGASVKIVSVGAGFGYGALGMSHHATEDLAIMRALPGMTVVAPGDPVEVWEATCAVVKRPGPCYLRLGRVGEPVVHDSRIAFELGRAIETRSGNDATIVVTGGLLPIAVDAADRLAELGRRVRVLSMHTVKPLDETAVLRAARETRVLVTLEEHSLIGGLGSAVAEVLCESDGRARFRRLGLPSAFATVAGSQQYLCASYGLTVTKVVDTVVELLGSVPRSRV